MVSVSRISSRTIIFHLIAQTNRSTPRTNYSTSYTPTVRGLRLSFKCFVLILRLQESCSTFAYLVCHVSHNMSSSNQDRTVVAIVNYITDVQIPVSAVAHNLKPKRLAHSLWNRISTACLHRTLICPSLATCSDLCGMLGFK